MNNIIEELVEEPKVDKKNTIHSLFNLSEKEPTYKPILALNKGIRGSSYNCNYDIVEDGEIIKSKRVTSCFSSITGARSDYNKEIYHFNPNVKSKKIYVYALSEDIDLKVSEIRLWVKFMKTLDLPFVFKEMYNYSLNYYGSDKYYPMNSTCFAKQKVYCMVIDYKHYKSIEQIKVLLYLFRYIYETCLFRTIREVIKYSKIHKDFDFVKTFFFLDLFNRRENYAHLINGKLITNIDNKSFKEYLDQFDDSKYEYKNMLMEYLSRDFKTILIKYKYKSAYSPYEREESYFQLSRILNKGVIKLDYNLSIDELIRYTVSKIDEDLLKGEFGQINLSSFDVVEVQERIQNIDDDLEEEYDEYYDDDDDY